MNAQIIPSQTIPPGWGFRFQPSLPKTKPGRGWGLSAAARDVRKAGPDLLHASTRALAKDLVRLYGITYAAAYSLVQRERHRSAA